MLRGGGGNRFLPYTIYAAAANRLVFVSRSRAATAFEITSSITYNARLPRMQLAALPAHEKRESTALKGLITIRHCLEWLLVVAFTALLWWAFIDRAAYINRTFGANINCGDCLTYPLLLHDLLYLASLLALLILSFRLHWCFCYLILRTLAVAGIIVYVADIAVMNEFFTRLRLGDVRIYSEQLPVVWQHIQNTGALAGYGGLLLLLVALTLMLVVLPPTGRISRRTAALMLLLPAAGTVAGAILTPTSYVHDWALRNVMAANFNTGVAVPYSDQLRQKVLNPETENLAQCQPGEGRAPDIVLLILESWSPYQSRLWSGLNDWTPNLDELAQQHSWYSRVHAGGFTTNEGLISILTGLEYIAPVKSFFHLMPFESAWETPEKLPAMLRRHQDYRSAFLTSGNLDFSGKRKWLQSLEFDMLEGHDYAGYKGQSRLHFDAVPDEVLYQRSLEYIDRNRNGKQPLFVTIENVSTHHPYIHPITGERSAEAVFRYMDKTATDFYFELREAGFFDNGLMIIISDHRAMVPIPAEEAEALGQSAASLIPAIIIGGPQPAGEIDTPFHQSDLLPSLEALVADEYCQPGPHRNLFRPEATEPRCLFHARGDNRSRLDVFCPSGNAVVALKGDDTELVKSRSIGSDQQERIIDTVNAHRIIGDERTRQLIESGYFD